MNGNRSKYTYTPTYGMQKKGMLKKNSPAREMPEAPDFTQVPDPAIGVPLHQTYQQTYQQPLFQPSAPQPASMSAPSYFTQQQPVQASFAAPAFVQPGQYAQTPPMQPVNTAGYQPPLRGGAVSSAQSNGFSARTQGFVPPVQQQTQQPPLGAQVPQIGWTSPRPAQQPIPPFSGMQPGAQPAQSYQPVQQPYPSFQPIPQQPGFTIQPNAPAAAPRTAAFDADKLWGIILFVLLPLLFIPCLFVSGAWDALRYVFIGTAVIGMGGMWYRQLYTPTSRLVVSIVYVALCITTIAMLMQETRDTRQASSYTQQTPQQTVTTPAPSDAVNQAVVPELVETLPPEATGPSEAEKRLSQFMELWKYNNSSEMVNYVQPSWRNQQQDPPAALFLVLANRTPEDFTIEEISGTETDNSRTVTMRATINKNTGKAPVVYRFMVMMVKEGNEWYVNPNSLATNDVATTEEENVVNTQGSGTVTEPPRETVTPAPPSSTPLYYNIGGNYYHMDPQCPSVAKEFLPFDASFLYSELRSYNNTLLPCLNCNAPVDPL